MYRLAVCFLLPHLFNILLLPTNCIFEAEVLAAHLAEHPTNWKDKDVIELGAGTGLVGILLAAQGKYLNSLFF